MNRERSNLIQKMIFLPAIIFLSSCSSIITTPTGDTSISGSPELRRKINLVNDSTLRETLTYCSNKSLRPTKFSIGHRGASLKYAEHTKESYIAAAKMGAGMIE